MERYRQQEFSPDVTLPMLKSENGDWVRYKDVAARIAELEAGATKLQQRVLELAENEAVSTANYAEAKRRISELEAQLATAQERNLIFISAEGKELITALRDIQQKWCEPPAPPQEDDHA